MENIYLLQYNIYDDMCPAGTHAVPLIQFL